MYLSDGNLRMKIPTWSIPAEITCPGSTTTCRNYCYAKKAERTYRNTRLSRIRNLNDSKRKDFVSKMIPLIERKKSKYVRVHESGDFYSQIYLDKWIDIANKFPEKTFLMYTQNYKLDYSKIPDNVVLYYTIWPDSRDVPKKGLKAYVIDNGSGKIGKYKIDLSKVKECKKGKGSKLKCENCMWCYHGKGDVKFKLH